MNILPLSAYPRPNNDNGSGMHGTANADFPLTPDYIRCLNLLQHYRFSWIKILSRENGNAEGIIDAALQRDMGVIVRMYRERPNPRTLNEQQIGTLRRWATKYKNKPVYIQFNNEPDLPDEWEGNIKPDNWLEIVAKNAIIDCTTIQRLGLIPVLPPAATGSPDFYNYRLIPEMLKHGGSSVFDGKHIVFGVHDYFGGHPTGDQPFQDAPYPYDSVNQAGRPLAADEFEAYGDVWQAWGTDSPSVVNERRRVGKNPNQKLSDYGAALGCLSYQQQYDLNIAGVLPAPIPVMSLEGGERVGMLFDNRYPRTSIETRIEAHKVMLARLWGATTRYKAPSWLVCHNPWLLDSTGSQWPLDGFVANGEVLPPYQSFFNWHRDNARPRNAAPPAPPVPPSEPQPMEEPVWVGFTPEIKSLMSYQPATVADGAEYWRATKVEYWNEERSQGLHHIYIQEPHDATLRALVNGQYPIWLDKPSNEPAGNYPMSGYGAVYDVRMQGLPSDIVGGMRMLGNRHISFVVEFKKMVKESETMKGYQHATKVPSPNFNSRPAVAVDSIVIHATGGGLAATLAHFKNPLSMASAHYTIDKNGDIYQHVSENKRAWHAGESAYNGRSDFNNFSIGIELVNDNTGRDPYPVQQIDALIRLVKDIQKRHSIAQEWFVTHAMVAPNRKSDPAGLDFDMVKRRIWTPPSGNLPRERMIDEAQAAQVIRFNPNAALQRAINRDGFSINSPEFTVDNYVCQRAESLSNGERRIYYVVSGDWGNVKNFTF